MPSKLNKPSIVHALQKAPRSSRKQDTRLFLDIKNPHNGAETPFVDLNTYNISYNNPDCKIFYLTSCSQQSQESQQIHQVYLHRKASFDLV
jgi:hypothetical protein